MTIEKRVVLRCDEPGCISVEGPFDNERAVRTWLRARGRRWAEVVRGGKVVGHRCPDHPGSGGSGDREPRVPVAPRRPSEKVRIP